MSEILVVDDDVTSLAIIEETLRSEGYAVHAYESAVEASELFEPAAYDLILSDFFMPGMNGDEFLKTVRRRDSETPFVFLTANTDIQLAIDLVKTGADDHITKPIVPEVLLFRIEKNLRDKQNERTVRQAERERELFEMERQKLVNWRLLYASKDIHQTEQMINLLSRTINQAGGFLWVDLLEQQMDSEEGETIELSRELIEMILQAGRGQKQVFDYISFISGLDELELDRKPVPVADFVRAIDAHMREVLGGLAATHRRTYYSMIDTEGLDGVVEVDMDYTRRIAAELVFNAVKYSPEDSRILLIFEPCRDSRSGGLDICVRNMPTTAQACDREGNRIFGIPYDYTELVFDLFYTIEAFPVNIEGEEWSDGTGLYVVRQLLRRQDAWVRAENGVDYTGDTPETFTKVTITLPVKEAS
ncbi:MAG: response regulator [Spirochaetes bacterium]|nr:response regulator [Spirochaetota bacterium]